MKPLIFPTIVLLFSAIPGLAEPSATAPAAPPVVEVQEDGSLLFKADGARIIGYKLHLEPKPIPTIVRWVDNREWIEWPKGIPHKGTYTVEITYSSALYAGGTFVVSAGASKVESHTKSTADWQTYRTEKLTGKLTVLNDDTTLALKCPNWIERILLNFRTIKLTPVADEPEKRK